MGGSSGETVVVVVSNSGGGNDDDQTFSDPCRCSTRGGVVNVHMACPIMYIYTNRVISPRSQFHVLFLHGLVGTCAGACAGASNIPSIPTG